MIKIVLHGNVTERKQTELELSKYFIEKKYPYEIHHVSSALKFSWKLFI